MTLAQACRPCGFPPPPVRPAKPQPTRSPLPGDGRAGRKD